MTTLVDTMPALAIDPFDEDFLADPYPHHDALRDAGPVVWLEKLGCYGIARHAEVQAALKDWETFCSGRGVGLIDFAKEQFWRPPSLLLEADPPLHDRTRRLVNKIVTPVALKALKPRWQEKANALADALVAMRRFDAVTDLAEVFPLLVFPETIGLADGGGEHLLRYAAAVFDGYGPDNDVLRRSHAAAVEATRWIDFACRRENLKPGGWGMALYEAADAGECTQEEAGRLVRSFLSAGVDTTVNGIGNMINAFVHFPGEWQRLREDASLIRRAFEEALRWDSTAQIFFRTTTREVEVSGAMIPEGAKVLLFLAAANRDPRRWEAPERFDIGRVASGHVGFGFGIHQCLGQMMARYEAEVVLEALLPRVAAWRATGPVERRLNNSLHALGSLPVEVEPAVA